MKKRFLINCECGCGEKIINLDKKARPRRFVSGHHIKLQDYSKRDNSHLLKYSYKKGHRPWTADHPELVIGEKNPFYGKKHSKKTKEVISKKVSEKHKGKSPKNLYLLMKKGEKSRFNKENTAKEKNNNWKGGITPTTLLERDKFDRLLRKDVLKRDNYTCQMCGVRGGNLHVDHIQAWEDFVELRFTMDNLRTLCVECHYQITFLKPMPKNSKWGKSKKGGYQNFSKLVSNSG